MLVREACSAQPQSGRCQELPTDCRAGRLPAARRASQLTPPIGRTRAPEIERPVLLALRSEQERSCLGFRQSDLSVRPLRSVARAHTRKHAAPSDVFQLAAARSIIEPVDGTT